MNLSLTALAAPEAEGCSSFSSQGSTSAVRPPRKSPPHTPETPPRTPPWGGERGSPLGSGGRAMAGGFGRYTHAVVRALPPALGGGEEEEEAGGGEEGGPGPPPLDLAKAHRQLGVYAGILRQKLGLQVVELPPAPGGLRALLLEDLAVVQGDTALLTRPWRPTRRHEVTATPRAPPAFGGPPRPLAGGPEPGEGGGWRPGLLWGWGSRMPGVPTDPNG